RFGVVVGGQFLDTVAKDFPQQRRIRREKWAYTKLGMCNGHHRAIPQVVPSLESFSTTPIAASSSRMRSDSLKFLAARAAALASMRLAIFVSSCETDAGRNALHSSAGSWRRPMSCALAFRPSVADFDP